MGRRRRGDGRKGPNTNLGDVWGDVGGIAALAHGDPVTAAIHDWAFGEGKPSYDANIETGGPFQATPYAGPQLQQGGPATSSMDLMGTGQAEDYWARNQGRTTGPSATGMTFAGQQDQLGRQGAQERTFAENQGQLQGPSASQGAWSSAVHHLSGPGETSQFRDQNQGQLQGPGQGEQYFNQVQGRFNQPTNSQQALQVLQQNPADFSGYYDRARERQAGGMNDQLAARGMYGSSAGVDMISEGMADLNAQQANREFDARMQQQQQMLGAAGQADTQGQSLLGMGIGAANQAQGQQLSRLSLGGQLAGQQQQELLARQGLFGNIAGQMDQADVSRFGALMGGAGSADAGLLGRLGMGMQGAQAADQVDLNRLTAGMQGAQGAQGARQGRIQQAFGNTMAGQQAVSGVLGNYLPGMLQQDQSLMDSQMAAEMGLGAEAVNMDRATTAERMGMANMGMQGFGQVADMVSSIYGFGGVGG